MELKNAPEFTNVLLKWFVDQPKAPSPRGSLILGLACKYGSLNLEAFIFTLFDFFTQKRSFWLFFLVDFLLTTRKEKEYSQCFSLFTTLGTVLEDELL